MNMKRIDFGNIEKKWQERWEKSGIFHAKENGKKKYYVLEMFPYPSAAGLHMGHIRNYSIGDAFARFKRMNGFNVLYPMGYDAFGLPAENAAIKNKTHPKEYTEKAIAGIRKNQKALGLSYDWTRELATCYPEYYKWNQWIFLKMMKKGLAYKKKAPVNWCPKCKTVLANEQVEDGKCWRCDSRITIKNLEQWFLKITKYAERLLKGLKKIDWPENVKIMQENWIGKSKGVLVDFKISGSEKKIPIFTTRIDTLYGVTFMVYAPEHPDVMELVKGTKYERRVKNFVRKVVLKDRFERTAEDKEKEGMFIGRYAINPATGKKIPIYIANFVLLEYGTGAIMAVPAHDQRDFEFAKKFRIPIKVVIKPPSYDLDPKDMSRAYTEPGILINSGKFNGSMNYDAIGEIADYLEKKKLGKKTTQYKLRDWLISRQRYWGTPIPVIYCDKCGVIPVPEKDLPVLLPIDVKFTGKGNPLASTPDFVNTKCPECGGKAKRETDTMDTFVDSSWYFLKYCSPKSKDMFDKKAVKYWMPVDQYIGGVEHAVMHLLYARFFTMVLHDLKLLSFDEPFLRLFNQGIVYKDGHKMSKSFGNVVTQEEISKRYGIDTARLFLLFVANPESQMEWSDEGVMGAYKFLRRVYGMVSEAKGIETKKDVNTLDRQVLSKTHKLIKTVTEGMENFRFNTAVGNLMSFVNDLYKYKRQRPNKEVLDEALRTLVLLLSPFTPHIAEEAWEMLGQNKTGKDFVSVQKWPKANEKLIDPKLELSENLIKQTIEDVKEIIKLVSKKPRIINIFVSPLWKYMVYDTILDLAKKPEDIVQAVMKTPEIRKQGKDAVRFAERLKKDIGRLGRVLNQHEELTALKEAESMLRNEFRCEVKVVKAEESISSRALRAEPGKPGIEVV